MQVWAARTLIFCYRINYAITVEYSPSWLENGRDYIFAYSVKNQYHIHKLLSQYNLNYGFLQPHCIFIFNEALI
jgi:hypothetical protein